MIRRKAWVVVTALVVNLACVNAEEPASSAGSSTSWSSNGQETTVDGSSSTGTTTGAGTETAAVTSWASTTGSTTGDSTRESSSSTTVDEGLVSLTITPPKALITVASGWSHPVAFSVAGLDSEGVEHSVDATWIVDDPSLGEITAKGGVFQARKSTAGIVHVEVSAEGLSASAQVTIERLDDHPSCAKPRPALTADAPAPGLFTKVVPPEYAGTDVYHGVYLPPDWEPGRRYPVIVESPCNKYGAFTGRVEDATLGYELAGCRSYIWIVVPYVSVDGESNLDYGWGDVPATIAYWEENIPRTIAEVGGDPSAVILTGFSRGAIGASYIGLHEPAIADLWLAFLMHSHADVMSNLTPDKGAGSGNRMGRVWGRTSMLSWGAEGDGGAVNSLKGVDLLGSFGYPITTLAVPGVGHTDAWMAGDEESRAVAQSWLFEAVAARPGTHTIRGRVVDENGVGVPGSVLRSGSRSAIADAHGDYALRGLVPGIRQVACEHPQWTCSPSQPADINDADAIVDFTVNAP